jgi:hypothetical protein
MLPVQPHPKKQTASTFGQITAITPAIHPWQEGRIAIVTDAGVDAVDAAASGAIVVAGRVLSVSDPTSRRRPAFQGLRL